MTGRGAPSDHNKQHLMQVQGVIHGIVTGMASSVRPLLGPHGQCRLVAPQPQKRQQQAGPIICRDSQTLLNLSSGSGTSHPMVAAMVLRMVKQVAAICGDGCGSTVILLGQLLQCCVPLMEQMALHPSRMALALDRAAKFCTETLASRSSALAISALLPAPSRANGTGAGGGGNAVLSLDDQVLLDREILLAVAKTGASCRLESTVAKSVAVACTDAMDCTYGNGLTVRELRDERVHTGKVFVQTCRHLNSKAEFLQGIAIDQAVRDPLMPQALKGCRILMLAEPLELVKGRSGAHAEFSTAEERVQLVQGEREVVDRKVRNIIETGCNLVISCAAIDPIAMNHFSQNGIAALRHVRRDVFDRIAGAVRGKVVHSIQNGLDKKTLAREWLGSADEMTTLISEHGGQRFTFIRGTAEPRTACIMLYGPTQHMLRLIHGACTNTLSILKNTFEDCLAAPGAGATEMALADRVRQRAEELDDDIDVKLFLSVAEAIENSVPAALCTNNGFVAQQCIDRWRREIAKTTSGTPVGIDLLSYPPKFINPVQNSILDSMRSKIQIVSKSMETLTILLKIDRIVLAESLSERRSSAMQKQLQRQEQQHLQQQKQQQSAQTRENMALPYDQSEDDSEEEDDDEDEIYMSAQNQEKASTTRTIQPREHKSSSQSKWKYRSYGLAYDRKTAWSQEAKERVRRKDEKFYSAKQTQRRDYFEKHFALVDPYEDEQRKQQQLVKQERQRRRRETGHGYSLDPFR